MALELTSLSTLDVAAVQEKQATITAAVQENNVSLELRRGVLHDLLAYYEAQLAQLTQTNIDRIQSGNSLKKIGEDPTLSDTDVVDAVLSNYNLTRKPGNQAAGEVTVVVNTNTTVTIGRGAIFVWNGLQFTSDEAYTAKAEQENIILPTDRLLTLLDDGNYAFNIEVTAEAEGPAYRLQKDTLLQPLTEPLTFVKSFASEDFADGALEETNAELLARQQEGIAAKALSNPVNMNATLREQFPYVVASSIVGYGDEEMLRDSRTIFPISYGGRTDWYVRTEEQARKFLLTKPAVLIEKTSDGYGIWQLSFGRDEVPGFYDVTRIVPNDAADTLGSFEGVADIRSLDLSPIGSTLIPDLIDYEGVYTRYQTAIIRFKDSTRLTSDLPVNTTENNYKVEVRGLSNLDVIQDYMASRSIHNTAGDVVVKAPVPCFLQLSFTIYKRNGDVDPDLVSIKDDLTSVVNTLPFGSIVASSRLFDVIHSHLTPSMTCSALDMFGKLRRPDGTIKYLRDTAMLIPPDEPEKMVSIRTVQFFLTPSDVAISIVTLPALES